MNITKELINQIKEYIIINYKPEPTGSICFDKIKLLDSSPEKGKIRYRGLQKPKKTRTLEAPRAKKEVVSLTEDEDFDSSRIKEKIEKKIDDTWQQSLFDIINEKKLDEVEVYKNACLTKQTFSKIRNDCDYHPDKDTAIRVCLGLKLELDDALDLLSKAGYTLSKSLERDLVIRYFFEKEIYDIYEIDIIFEELNLKQFLKY